MATSSAIQSRVSPPQVQKALELSPLPVSGGGLAKDSNQEPAIDFRTVLQGSNADTTRERGARKANGDLSTAKTDEEFRKMLNDRANPLRTPKNQMDKDDFLKLFIAQMQNQDPLSPQDNSQMAAQLAQFNGLEQMLNMNKHFETLLKAQATDRSLSMVNYIGKEVSLSNGLLKFDGKETTKGSFKTDFPVAEASLEVRNSAGVVIGEQTLGNVMPGEHPVVWDGKGKDGKLSNPGVYTFNIVGKSSEGEAVTIPITSKVKITGLDMRDESGGLFTEIGKIKISDIASVGAPGYTDGLVASKTKTQTDLDLSKRLEPQTVEPVAAVATPVTEQNSEHKLEPAK